jgi:glycosyltransferase involved in cell wall biosynthesis
VPRVLYLVHSLPPEEYTGTPLFAHGYARSLAARGWDVTVVYPSRNASTWIGTAQRWPGEEFTRIELPLPAQLGAAWSIEAPSQDPGRWSLGAAEFGRILRRVEPDLVHVVNNVHLPLDLPELAKARGLPVVRSVTCAEDLCALIAPVSPRSGPNGYCVAPLTPEQCARCVADAPLDVGGTDAAGLGELERRLVRKRARAAAQYHHVFDRVIFATAGFRDYFEQTLPLDPARVRVIEMGMDVSAWPHRPAPARRRAPDEPIVFGLAGAWDPVKVAPALVEAFTHSPLLDRHDYRLVCWGAGHERLVAPLSANPNVELHGPFRADDLPSLLGAVDVGLAPSNFETFHRVTREYLLAGRPVIGARAFGILDIIRHGTNGLLFDHADPGALARAVTAVLDDRALLERLTHGAAATRVRSSDEEADDLVALYDDVLAREPSRPRHAVMG